MVLQRSYFFSLCVFFAINATFCGIDTRSQERKRSELASVSEGDQKRHSPEMSLPIQKLALVADERQISPVVLREKLNLLKILRDEKGLGALTLHEDDFKDLPDDWPKLNYARWLLHDIVRFKDVNVANIALLSKHCDKIEAADLRMEAAIAKRKDVIAVLTQRIDKLEKIDALKNKIEEFKKDPMCNDGVVGILKDQLSALEKGE